MIIKTHHYDNSRCEKDINTWCEDIYKASDIYTFLLRGERRRWN
jgi:hypothetical protein